MNKGCLTGLAILVGGGLIFFVLAGMIIGRLNDEAQIATAKEAKQLDCKSEFDNMWKKLANIAEVPPAAAESLQRIFSDYAQARTGNSDGKGSIMNWIQESCPQVAPDSLGYKEMMNLIVSSRDAWTMHQKALIGLHQEHMLMFREIPGSWILKMFGRKLTDITIITSSRTENAFATGKDDDVQLLHKSQEVERK